MTNARRLSTDNLCQALADARQATLSASMDLSDEQWVMPYGVYIQPMAWDLGHIGWFAEFWLLRGPHRLNPMGCQQAAKTAKFFSPDEDYDSSIVVHTDRWKMPLFARHELAERLAAQLWSAQAHIRSTGDDPNTNYFAHLTLLHELMHVEALAWTRAECGYPTPPGMNMPKVDKSSQIVVPTGQYRTGERDPEEFAFDNEGPAVVRHGEFSIDSHPVRNDAFVAFVEDGGYGRAEFWPDQQARGKHALPARWRRTERGDLEHRHYDQWLPLPVEEPVVHISAIEAEAFCRWAGRKLPTARQWEIASQHGTHWGNSVWEWTATTFHPYPCFRPGPYVTYSAPWFHHQRELRGGAYTTHTLMHDARYRNFFLPHRTDAFTGFRTVDRH
jgi:ergothioneine biosynthesis protein EgtB